MIPHTAQQLVALKDSPRAIYLLEFTIGTTDYYFTNSDETIVRGNTYLPGFIDEMDDIEITSDPKINDNETVINDEENLISTALRSEQWMNNDYKITKLFLDKNGAEIMAKVAYEGLMSDFSIDTESSLTTLTASSIWADFEKTSGTKTNSASQQRFYPDDTAFEHSKNAVNKIYWGKEAPKSATGSGMYIDGSRYSIPVADA